MSREKDLRDFLFRGLTFEAEAEEFRGAGLRIGADQASVEARLLEETLAPFGVQLRNESLQMARLYALVYCFENSVRDLIRSRLTESYGADWWNKGVTQAARAYADTRRTGAEKDTWLEGAKIDPLAFVDFGHLAKIIIHNWELFADLIPSQHWISQRMDELEKARHYIAHNRLLLAGEFARMEMYVSDWNRAVGL